MDGLAHDCATSSSSHICARGGLAPFIYRFIDNVYKFIYNVNIGGYI